MGGSQDSPVSQDYGQPGSSRSGLHRLPKQTLHRLPKQTLSPSNVLPKTRKTRTARVSLARDTPLDRIDPEVMSEQRTFVSRSL